MQNAQKRSERQNDMNTKDQLLKELLEQNRNLANKIEKLEQSENHDPDFYKRIFIVVSVVVVVGLIVFLIAKVQEQESTIYKQQKYQEVYKDITEKTKRYM